MKNLLKKYAKKGNDEAWALSEYFKRPPSEESREFYEECCMRWSNLDGSKPAEYFLANALVIFSMVASDFYDDQEDILEAITFANHELGIVSGYIGIKENLSEFIDKEVDSSLLSSRLAIRRHAETYITKNKAIEYWKKNIDPKLSAEKAADEMFYEFSLSHKKLAEYISKEKKKLNT